MLIALFIFLVVYQIKHFLCDYPFQTEWMLGKFKSGKGWILPLGVHALVHAIGTFLVCIFIKTFWAYSILYHDWQTVHYSPEFPLWELKDVLWDVALGSIGLALKASAIDFVVHFTMDRIKASPNLMGHWKPLTPAEWVEAKKWAGVKCVHPKEERGEDCDYYIAAADKLRGNRLFWWSLGLDQMVHHLTHYFIIYMLLS